MSAQPKHTSIVIEPYGPQHFSDAVEIAREIHKASVFADFPLDEKKLIYHLTLASTGTSSDRYLRIASREGKVLGGFYGCIQKTYFSDGIVAKDLGWFVRQDARGGPAAVLLLEDFEWWAMSKGARKVMLGQITGERVEQVAKLYQHCGYRITGYNVVKDISHGL